MHNVGCYPSKGYSHRQWMMGFMNCHLLRKFFKFDTLSQKIAHNSAEKGLRFMKRSYGLVLSGLLLLALGGCKKNVKKEEVVADKKDHSSAIFTAFNTKDYEGALHHIGKFVEAHPEDAQVASFKLMVADIKYEQGKFAESYEGYHHFQQYYPADTRAEYASYKAAHARFNQANHVSCDTSAVEDTMQLCNAYKEREDFQQFRPQIEDLFRTCQQHMIDNEFYVVNSYLNQNRLQSAKHRLASIEEKYNFQNSAGRDKLLFYQAKLAKCEHNQDKLVELVNDLNNEYPRSTFTAMASRLSGQSGTLLG